MKGILLLIFLGFQLSVFAQQGGSIPHHRADSAQQAVVLQYRRVLLDKFRANRLDSVSMLVDSLDSRKIAFLWPAERLLLYYWIERYHAIDLLAWHFDEASKEAEQNHPADQIVWNVLSYNSSEKIDTLVSWVDHADCTDKEFRFRVSLLEVMLHGNWDNQTDVKKGIITFVDHYMHDEEIKQSETMPIIPQPVSSEQKDDPWNAGFGLGLGPASLSGNIANYLSTKTCLSFNLNVYYRRWYFSLLMQPIFAKLKRDIPINNGNDVWQAGESANISNFGLSLGYSIINSRYFKISPFIGMSVSECSPSEQQMEDNAALNDAGIRWGFSSMYGIDTEIKLYSIMRFMERKDFLASFNIRLNYIPAMFSNVNARYSGNMFLVTFGISMDVSSW